MRILYNKEINISLKKIIHNKKQCYLNSNYGGKKIKNWPFYKFLKIYIYDSEANALSLWTDWLKNEYKKYCLIDKKNGISYPEIINSLKFFSSELKDHIISKITSNSVNFLETRIKETDDLRNENPINGVQLGKSLYGDSKDELKQLENILGSDDVKYQILADNRPHSTDFQKTFHLNKVYYVS